MPSCHFRLMRSWQLFSTAHNGDTVSPYPDLVPVEKALMRSFSLDLECLKDGNGGILERRPSDGSGYDKKEVCKGRKRAKGIMR